MSPHRERPAERRVRGLRAPDEGAAEERAWQVARSVYRERAAVPQRGSRRRPLALVPILAVIAGVLALTPAGATVHRWIDQTLGVPHASRELFALPAPGQILVSGPGGVWIVSADGAKRRLGSWRQATWSARGNYLAVAARDELSAIDRRGMPQWAIARPGIRFPRWFSPNGYRVSYLSGHVLRVIAGDGTGDRQLANGVAGVAPAWRWGHQYELAYVTRSGAIVVQDADSGAVAWSRRLRDAPTLLGWSADGARLMAITPTVAFVFDAAGRTLARLPLGPGSPAVDAALAPDGNTLAVLSARDVTLTSLSPRPGASRRVFTGQGLRQLAWSPEGQWLLVSWPAADQWIFVHATGRPRIAAVSRIAEQLAPGWGAHAFPQLDGWCCTTGGNAG